MVVNKRLNEGLALGLSEDFIKGFLKLIHEESIRRQAEVMNVSVEEIATNEENS